MRGRDVVRVGRDPAAGAEVAITVPGYASWELICLRLELVTSVDVANRRVRLLLDDQSVTIYEDVKPADQAASLTRQYVFAAGVGYNYGGFRETVELAGIPRFRLAPGMRLRTVTTNLQAADNYAAPVLYVCEYGAPSRADELADELLAAAREAGEG